MAFTRSETANGTSHLITTGFRSILIPVNTAQPELPRDMLDVAAYLATERRSSIVLLTFTEIPLWEEMDVELPGLEGHVETMARQARAIAGPARRRRARDRSTYAPAGRPDPARSTAAQGAADRAGRNRTRAHFPPGACPRRRHTAHL